MISNQEVGNAMKVKLEDIFTYDFSIFSLRFSNLHAFQTRRKRRRNPALDLYLVDIGLGHGVWSFLIVDHIKLPLVTAPASGLPIPTANYMRTGGMTCPGGDQ